MTIKHFDQKQLAERWGISPKTLERWRWLGQGPKFLKLGSRILYRREDIETYEAQQLRQAQVTHEAAREIGRWLEARGRLHQPIAALSLGELECMATTAISRFVALATERIREQPEDDGELAALLYPGSAPSAAGRPGASDTPASSASMTIPATASARCAASTPARRRPKGTTA